MTADNYTLLNTFPNDNFPQNEFITTKIVGLSINVTRIYFLLFIVMIIPNQKLEQVKRH